MKKTHEFSRLIKLTLVMLLFVTGCAGKDLQTESDKVFTEWKAKAETSRVILRHPSNASLRNNRQNPIARLKRPVKRRETGDCPAKRYP